MEAGGQPPTNLTDLANGGRLVAAIGVADVIYGGAKTNESE